MYIRICGMSYHALHYKISPKNVYKAFTSYLRPFNKQEDCQTSRYSLIKRSKPAKDQNTKGKILASKVAHSSCSLIHRYVSFSPDFNILTSYKSIGETLNSENSQSLSWETVSIQNFIQCAFLFLFLLLQVKQ